MTLGKRLTFLAEQAVGADMVEALQHGARADPYLLAQDAIRSDVGGRIDPRAGRHNRRGMDAGGKDRLGKNSGRIFANAIRALGTRMRVLRLEGPVPSMMIAEAALCSARAK